MKQLKWILVSLGLFLNLHIGLAQGWVNQIEPYSENVDLYDFEQTTDSGYILCGTKRLGWGSTYFYLVRTDVNGDTSWTKTSSFPARAYAVQQTTDGGFIVAGEYSNFFYVVKTDANGDTLWTKTSSSIYRANDILQTTDGGYIVGTETSVVKLDSIGNISWVQLSYRTKNQGTIQELTTGYIVGDESRLVKTNASGDTLWTRTYMNGNFRPRSIIQTIDGGYLLGGFIQHNSVYQEATLIKTNASGDTLWTKSFNSSNYGYLSSVKQHSDGSYIISGRTQLNITESFDAFFAKLDTFGTIVWLKNKLGSFASFQKAIPTIDLEYACLFTDTFSMTSRSFIIKTDTLGNSYSNIIQGSVFQDNDYNCINNAGDYTLKSVILKMEDAIGNIFYGTTDINGNYSIPVSTGNYTLTVESPMYYYAFNCQANPFVINLTSTYQQQTIDFPLDPIISCPLLQVDISTPILRKIVSSNYNISYCNHGTIDAINSTVEVEIDPDLNVLGTSIPIVSQNGNIYSFNIGTIGVNQCGSFTITVAVKLSALDFQTHCSEAHIYPDTICILNYWNDAILDVDAQCQNDTVFFILQNIGSTPMTQPVPYYVYEDNVMFRASYTNILGVGASQQIVQPAIQGKTYRIIVNQEAGFPPLLGDSTATTAIEGCYPFANGSFNTGFITQFSNGNSSPFVAIDCRQNRASYDPNDKSAQPEGYDTPHYIYNYTALDYQVRFQNTGNDTAFLVVVRDTISPYLDIATLEMGASSHPYTWRIYGQGILEVTFSNIMLPDSNVNEPASNGFFRYRINQKAGNPNGTVIYNMAAIYFDFNAPVLTNQTWHIIGDNFVTILLSVENIVDKTVEVLVYPNPFSQTATIEIQGKDYNELNLSIFDITGRQVAQEQAFGSNKIQVNKGSMQTGIYFYKLEGDGKLINSGKLIVSE